MRVYFDTIPGRSKDIADFLKMDSTSRFYEAEFERFSRLRDKDKSDPINAIRKGMFNDFYYWGYGDKTVFCLDSTDDGIELMKSKLNEKFSGIEFRTNVY